MNKMMLLCTLSVFMVGCSSTAKTVSAPAKTTVVASTAPAPAPTTTNAAVSEKKESEVVCKMQKVLGSNVKKKVCTTKTRIAENEADTKRMVTELSVGNTQSILDQ